MNCRLLTVGFNSLGHPIRNALRKEMVGNVFPIKKTASMLD